MTRLGSDQEASETGWLAGWLIGIGSETQAHTVSGDDRESICLQFASLPLSCSLDISHSLARSLSFTIDRSIPFEVHFALLSAKSRRRLLQTLARPHCFQQARFNAQPALALLQNQVHWHSL